MSNFSGDLVVSYIDGNGWTVVGEGFTYRLGTVDGPEFVTIGKGMRTDFASMPPFVRVVFRSPGGKWDKPAVIHDCLYKTGYVRNVDGTIRRITRKEADDIFLEAMQVAGVNWLSRYVIYSGVRAGGMVAWNRHREADTE